MMVRLRGNEMGDIKKGPWKVVEDEVLINHVNKYGPRDWSSIRSKGLLRRTGKSCRLRWVNKLRPDLKTGVKFSPEEERTVIELQAQFGNKWAKIATYFPGRTDNDVKNFWSSRQKRLARILHSSTPPPSSSTKEIQTPAFHILPSPKVPVLSGSICSSIHNEAREMVCFPDMVYPVYDHSGIPFEYMYMPPEKKEERGISFPQFHPDYPMPMENQDSVGGLGVPSSLEDEFEHSSRSALGSSEVPSHETEGISTLIVTPRTFNP